MIADDFNIHQMKNVPIGAAFFVSSNIEIQNFENLLPESMQSAHPKAKKNWYLSRMLLMHAFEKMQQKINWSDLIFDGFQKIKSKPNFRFSISHTEDAALVWLVEESQNFCIGVDVESVDREIQTQLMQKINNGEDIDLPPLQLWGIKEASYKTISENHQQDLFLNRFVIKKDHFFLSGTEQMGNWMQMICEDKICSLAWMEK